MCTLYIHGYGILDMLYKVIVMSHLHDLGFKQIHSRQLALHFTAGIALPSALGVYRSFKACVYMWSVEIRESD